MTFSDMDLPTWGHPCNLRFLLVSYDGLSQKGGISTAFFDPERGELFGHFTFSCYANFLLSKDHFDLTMEIWTTTIDFEQGRSFIPWKKPDYYLLYISNLCYSCYLYYNN